MGSILASVASKNPTTTTSALERNCEEHYQVLERQFALDCKWTWYVHGILTLVSIGMYLVVMGKELVFALYIPLDIMLNISLVVFFWYEYFKFTSKQKSKQEKKNKMESLSVEEAIKRARLSVERVLAEHGLKSERR